MMPFISVIIPVYNVEKYISDCLDSVLNQTFADCEIICVDDGSSDRSRQILDEYEREHNNIKVVHQENQGQSIARNVGISFAGGEYVCFLDSDDMLAKDAFYVLHNAVEHDRQAEIINYEMSDIIYGSSYLQAIENRDAYYEIKNSYEGSWLGRDLLTKMIENDEFVDSAGVFLIKRKWLLENKLIFEPHALYEDAVFALDCFLKAKCMIHLKDKLYVYRVRENSTMTGKMTIRNLRWRLWQFDAIIRRIHTEEMNARAIEALTKYARQIMGNIKCVYEDLELADRERVNDLTSLDGLIAESLGLNPARALNRDLALEGLLSVIKRKEKILLYGAGVVGGKLLKLLKRGHIQNKVCGFAISSEPDPDSGMRDGIAVKYIGEYAPEDVDLLVISSCKYHSEMVKKAKELGFSEILLIDHNMEHAIDRHFSNRY